MTRAASLIAGAVVLVAIASGCISVTSRDGSSTQATPVPAAVATQKPAPPAATTGGSQAGNTEDVCALFTPAEIAGYVGAPVDSGLANATIHTCVWTTADGEGTVLIQVVPASYYEEHSLDTGYHKVSGIGDQASITKAIQGDGLSLTVKQGDNAYFVDLVPATADQQVIDLGRVFIARYEAL